MQVRRNEIKQQYPKDKCPPIHEITRMCSQEWNSLNDGQKETFNIPADVQMQLRVDNNFDNVALLKKVVYDNIEKLNKQSMS